MEMGLEQMESSPNLNCSELSTIRSNTVECSGQEKQKHVVLAYLILVYLFFLLPVVYKQLFTVAQNDRISISDEVLRGLETFGRKLSFQVKAFGDVANTQEILDSLRDEFEANPVFFSRDSGCTGPPSAKCKRVSFDFEEHPDEGISWSMTKTAIEEEKEARRVFPTTSNTYDLLVMCRPGGEGDAVQVVVSSHRGILIECASNSSSPRCPLGRISKTVRDLIELLLIPNEEIVYEDHSSSGSDAVSRGEVPIVPFSQSYNMVFLLAVGGSGKVKLHWDIKDALNAYITPLLDELKHATDFNITSKVDIERSAGAASPQILVYSTKKVQYYTELATRPYVGYNNKGDVVHYFPLGKNPHLLSPSDSIDDPTFNFVIYITDKSIPPLYILQNDGRITHGNSVIINNNTMMAVNNDFLYSNAEGEYRLDPEYIKNTFSSFATQLKLLFGLPYLTKTKLSGIFPNAGITLVPHSKGISRIELDSLRYLWIYRAASRVLDSILLFKETANSSKVRIPGNVLSEFEVSVEGFVKSLHYFRKNRLDETIASLKSAHISSEKALLGLHPDFRKSYSFEEIFSLIFPFFGTMFAVVTMCIVRTTISLIRERKRRRSEGEKSE